VLDATEDEEMEQKERGVEKGSGGGKILRMKSKKGGCVV